MFVIKIVSKCLDSGLVSVSVIGFTTALVVSLQLIAHKQTPGCISREYNIVSLLTIG
jgi:hypothetical protein